MVNSGHSILIKNERPQTGVWPPENALCDSNVLLQEFCKTSILFNVRPSQFYFARFTITFNVLVNAVTNYHLLTGKTF